MSKTQRNRIEELERALRMAHAQLNYLPCIQGCTGGAIQLSEDDFEQCQCCGEREVIRNVLGLDKESTDLKECKVEHDDLPF